MSTWKGISHARMTRSMSGLSGAEYKVLGTVRRLIPDGMRRKISHEEIAEKAKVSEGTVSRALRKFDGIYLHRYFLGRGRGRGYEIEMLPPPEQRSSMPQKGSPTDLSHDSLSLSVATPQTPPEKGSPTDLSILLDHAHEQHQQHAAEKQTELDPETIAELRQANAHPKVIAKIAAITPTLTPAMVRENIAQGRLREIDGSARDGIALTFGVLAVGQTVAPPKPRSELATPERPPAPTRRRQQTAHPEPINPDAYRDKPGWSVGDDPPPELPPDADDDNVFAVARRLAPAAEGQDLVVLCQRLLDGDSPDQALATMHARSERRQAALRAPRDHRELARAARVLGGRVT
jgi:hypothetical protein